MSVSTVVEVCPALTDIGIVWSKLAVTPGGSPSILRSTLGFWLLKDCMESLVEALDPCRTGPMNGGEAKMLKETLVEMTLKGLVSLRGGVPVSVAVSGWMPNGISDGTVITAVKDPLVTLTGVVKVMVLGPS